MQDDLVDLAVGEDVGAEPIEFDAPNSGKVLATVLTGIGIPSATSCWARATTSSP
jgi:hypothetical protein